MKACIYVDGGYSIDPERVGVAAVAISEEGSLIATLSHTFEGSMSNNWAEYQALRVGVCLAHLLDAEEAHFVSDSQLVVRQVGGFWAISSKELGVIHGFATSDLMTIPWWSIRHVKREFNSYADYLVCRALESPRTLKKPPALSKPLFAEQMRAGWVNTDKRSS